MWVHQPTASGGPCWYCTERLRARFLSGFFQLFILNDQELILANLVVAAFIVGLHDFARDGIDELLAQPMASFSIDLPE